MRALQLINGDIALGPRGYAEVTGLAKVQQDLAMAILTPFGSDRFHAQWGSVLDSMIGSPQGPLTTQTVQNEVQRVVSNYMLLQQAQLAMAQANGYVSPYSNEEIVTGVVSITSSSTFDLIQVVCTVTTAANTTSTITASVSPSGVTGTVS